MTDLEFKIQLHNKLCELADLILYQYNPCQIRNGKCLDRDFPCCSSRFNRKDTGKCMFLKEKGCGGDNVVCKVWLCDKAEKTNEECTKALKIIEELAKLYGFTT